MAQEKSIKLIIENKEILCNKGVLCDKSDYFKAMFGSQMSECSQNTIELKDISFNAFRQIWEYYESHIFEVEMATMFDVLATSRMLQFEDMNKRCIDYLTNSITVSNCCSVLMIASHLSIVELHSLAYSFIMHNFKYVNESGDYSILSLDEFRTMLDSNELNCESEMSVFEAIRQFFSNFDSEKEELSEAASCLLACIRYEYLTQEEIESIKADPWIKNHGLSLNVTDKDLPKEASISSTPSSRCYPHDCFAVLRLALEDRDEGTSRAPPPTKSVIYRISDDGTNLHRVTDIPIPETTFGYQVCGLEQCVYIVGGELTLGSGRWMMDIWRYDSWTDEWTRVANLAVPRRNHALTADCHGNLYVAGGFSRYRQKLMSVSKFNPSTEDWTSLPDLPVFIYQSTLAVADNTLYACSGFQFYTLDLTNPECWKSYDLEDILTREQHDLLKDIEIPSGCIRHLINSHSLYFIAEKILVLDLKNLEVEMLCDMSRTGEEPLDGNKCIPELREPFYYHIGHDAVYLESLSNHSSNPTEIPKEPVTNSSEIVRGSEINSGASGETDAISTGKVDKYSCKTDLVMLFAIIERDQMGLHSFRQNLDVAKGRNVVRNMHLNERYQKDVQLVTMPRLLTPRR